MLPSISRLLRASALITALLAPPAALAAEATLPAGTTAYSPGIFYDMLSWHAFINTLRTADHGGPTFECWATNLDTFPANPTSTPPNWPNYCQGGALAVERFHVSRLAQARHAELFAALPAGVNCNLPPDPKDGNFPTGSASDCIAEEVRRNRDTFDFIAHRGLYWKTGLAAAFKQPGVIEFPWSAVEFKGDWTPVPTLIKWLAQNGVTITPEQVDKEYFTTVDKGVKYALLSFHISTKQLPNWLWATFEHKRNPARCDVMGCYDQFGAVEGKQKVPPNATANAGYGDCPKPAMVKEMFAFAKVPAQGDSYCLKATQIVGAKDGLSVLDGDSVIEVINASVQIKNSSCLTCHAYAAVDATGGVWRGSNNPGLAPPGPIGPNPLPLPADAKSIDFIWSILAAH
jgi:hypothetical protein